MVQWLIFVVIDADFGYIVRMSKKEEKNPYAPPEAQMEEPIEIRSFDEANRERLFFLWAPRIMIAFGSAICAAILLAECSQDKEPEDRGRVLPKSEGVNPDSESTSKGSSSNPTIEK